MKLVSVRWFYKVEACITIHMSLYVLSQITAWTQGRPLLPALCNSGRFLTIPLRQNQKVKVGVAQLEKDSGNLTETDEKTAEVLSSFF